MTKLLDRTQVNDAVLEFLWSYDKIIYILQRLGLYDELANGYSLQLYQVKRFYSFYEIDLSQVSSVKTVKPRLI